MGGPPILILEPPVTSLEEYLWRGGGEGLKAARKLGPDGVIEEIEASGLRGRGGGGFPTGLKWRGVRDAGGSQHYAVCNAAEGEPATFKDREILRMNPYQVVEGLAIGAFAVGATEAYIGIKGRFERETRALTVAIAEMEAADLLPDLTLALVEGPDEYLFGEEKALLEVIEGRDPLPRLFPPYVHGLFATAPQMGWSASAQAPGGGDGQSNPTLVNNVETLANVPHILARGAEWFRSRGTEESPGTVVCTIVGDVVTPQVVEIDMGTPLAGLIERAGGVPDGRSLKAVLSGVANPVVTGDEIDVRISYEAFEAIGSGLGAAGFAVYDDRACMVRLALEVSRFLYVESCNQCPACKFGTGEITAYLEQIERGEGSEQTLELIGARLRTVADANRCFLPEQERRVVASLLRAFPEEFADHLDGGCPAPRDLPLPKLVELGDDGAVYDERQAKKRPDWTYID